MCGDQKQNKSDDVYTADLEGLKCGTSREGHARDMHEIKGWVGSQPTNRELHLPLTSLHDFVLGQIDFGNVSYGELDGQARSVSRIYWQVPVST